MTEGSTQNAALARIQALRRRGALAQAMTACQTLIRQSPRDAQALLVAAAISRESQNRDQALFFIDRAIKAEPQNPEVQGDAARLQKLCGDMDGAANSFHTALTLDPRRSSAHLGMAEICLESGRQDDAVYHLQLAVANDPDGLHARVQLAKLLDVRDEHWQAADLRRETMRRAQRRIAEEYTRIRTPSGNAPARSTQRTRLSWAQALLAFGAAGMGLAKFQEEQEGPAEALQTYERTLSLLAEAQEQASSLDGLRRTFEISASAYAQCHLDMAMLQKRSGNAGAAIHHLEEALQLRHGDWPEAFDLLGEAAEEVGGTIATIRDLVASYQDEASLPAASPITRWDFSRHARNWLVSVVNRRKTLSPRQRRRIAMLACSPADIQISFAIACVLLARGHRVDFLWLPGIRFHPEGDPEPKYDRWDEKILSREMTIFGSLDLPSGLRILDLRNVVPAEPDEGATAIADRIAQRDLYRHAGTTMIDMAAEPALQQQHQRMLRNLDVMLRFTSYLSKVRPDHLILHDPSVQEGAAVFQVAQANALPVVAWWEGQEIPETIVTSVNGTSLELDIAALWQSDAPHRLTADRRERMVAWLSTKTGGDHVDAVPRTRHVPSPDARLVIEELRLSPDKPTVVLFAQPLGDPEVVGRHVVFHGVGDWIAETIAFFGRQGKWQLVVKMTAGDDGSRQDEIIATLRHRAATLPDNVRIVPTLDPGYSYRLLSAAQLGLYYTDSIGVEMAMFGIQAITPAKPYFTGLGFTREAEYREQYFRILQQALDDPEASAMTPRQIELAWCFADLVVAQAPKLFPWLHRSFWPSAVEDWPMARVLGEDGWTRFESAFRILAGEVPLPNGIVGLPDSG